MNIPYSLIFSIIISWGLWALVAKMSAQRIGIQSVFWVNVAVCTLVIIYLFISRQVIPLKGDFLGVALGITAGIFAGFGTILFYTLLSKQPVGILIAMTSLYPIITIILAVVFLKESLSTIKIIGVLMALVALFLLNL